VAQLSTLGRPTMPLSFDQIIAGLAALKAEDFDESLPDADGIQKLYALTDALELLPEPERCIRAMFDVMERMPTADLGSPGSLVHALERMRGRYESELVASIKRLLTPSTVWMINRIINGTRDSKQRQIYLDLLRFAAEHPTAPESAKRDAQHFIEYQTQAA
jgi:hypothetical protein